MKRLLFAVVLLAVASCGGGGGTGGAQQPLPPPPQGMPFGLDTRPAVAAVNLPTQAPQPGTFSLDVAFPNLSFSAAIYVSGVPGDARLVVMEQGGRLWAFAPSAIATNAQRRLVLDLSGQVQFSGEQGLLGLAFDPDFATNRFIYVHYSRSGSGTSRIARFTWDSGADIVSLASEKTILELPQPAANHNGGALAFGGDGLLYVAFGDGGGGGDTYGNGQNLATWHGSILRIDVHPSNPADAYDVPPTNPFIGRAGALPEIWAFGLRNPFRFSFDRQNGNLWLGDVGQNAREEIDIVTSGGNYGWSRFEGTLLFNSGVALASGTSHTPPVLDYPRTDGAAVIGGYVYRGSRLASLFGRYLYADYISGNVWALTWNGAQVIGNQLLDVASNPTSFGETNAGELYLATQSGTIYELSESGGGGALPSTLSATGLFSDLANLAPVSGLIEYDINHPFWSDGALKRRWLRVPAGQRITFSPAGDWVFPVGTVFVKHFEMEMTEGNPASARRLETRVLVRGSNEWFGFTYRWNGQETDADLLAARETEILTIQVPGVGARQQQYDYPSRTDCLQCHTAGAGFALGVRTRQVNRDFAFPLATDNQLRTYNHIALFSTDISPVDQYQSFTAPDDAGASLTARARTYLDVNCAQCHRPGGSTGVDIDLRFDTSTNAMNAVGAAPQAGDLGIANARIIAAGSKETSVLWQRVRALDGNRMPPIASHLVDQTAVDVLGAWIDAL